MSYLDVDINNLVFWLSSLICEQYTLAVPPEDPQLSGEFSGCVWMCSGARVLCVVWGLTALCWLCVQDLWEQAALLPRALCLVCAQTAERPLGQQVLCYCHSSQRLYCIINANSHLTSQLLLLFSRFSYTKFGRSLSLVHAKTGKFKLWWGGSCGSLASGRCDLCSGVRAPCSEGSSVGFNALWLPSRIIF